jgi:predicted nuclease with TOPRIM domain
MTDKRKKPPFDPSFDPSIPEDGVDLPDDEAAIRDLYSNQLPTSADIANTAREAFGDKLPDDLVQNVMHSSAEINESVRRIMHEHMNLGFRFGEIVRTVQTSYASSFGDNSKTQQRAFNDALAYIEKLHRISNSKIRLHLRAYARFHDNSDAVEFLRLTDMQYLLTADVGDDIVDAIIQKRKDDPEMTTRAVRDLVSVMRQQHDRIASKNEQLEAVNDEYASLLGQFTTATSETGRLRQEIEQMRAEQADAQAATHRLRNELSAVSNTTSALHQQLRDMEQQRDAARRDAEELRNRPPSKDDPQVRSDLRKLEEQYAQLLKETQELDDQVELKRGEATRISEQLNESTAVLEASRRLDEEMNALVKEFSGFAQRYHTAQLLCTADGNPVRFKPVFQALGDLVGKFHQEITAASNTA